MEVDYQFPVSLQTFVPGLPEHLEMAHYSVFEESQQNYGVFQVRGPALDLLPVVGWKTPAESFRGNAGVE